ncbi:MAG: RnfABCDGE type electron transport complex subunit D [Leptospiraceae bacterium]|nr:RnfABCDGE type electron transport complex subunit D [Leptospiraceae bacterium]MCP5484470.1 RnfABCDGE type electron transport complex subunit D [Spirochaetales bacterium]
MRLSQNDQVDPAKDPRHYQIACLLTMVVYQSLAFDFTLLPAEALLLIGTALLSQAILGYVFAVRFEWRSACISGLSLVLLLRTESPAMLVLAPLIAISSKFLIRYQNRHVFNPTNLAIILLLLSGAPVWVSPGAWGSSTTLAFLALLAGGAVVHKALRQDVTIALLFSYGAIVIGRGLFLGDPIAIAVHQLTNGTLLIFAFFMISDPKTTPDSRVGRIFFAALVAVGAAFIQFALFRPNGLLYALVFCSLLTPALNRVLPGTRFEWRTQNKSGPESWPTIPTGVHP